MVNGVGMVLGTSGNCRGLSRVISLAGGTAALACRFKASLTDSPFEVGRTRPLTASLRLQASSRATASVHTKERGSADAHQL